MYIGGAKAFADVTRQSFSRMAEEVGMRPQLVLERLDKIVRRIVPAAQTLASDMNAEWPSEVYSKIVSVVERQVKSVAS